MSRSLSDLCNSNRVCVRAHYSSFLSWQHEHTPLDDFAHSSDEFQHERITHNRIWSVCHDFHAYVHQPFQMVMYEWLTINHLLFVKTFRQNHIAKFCVCLRVFESQMTICCPDSRVKAFIFVKCTMSHFRHIVIFSTGLFCLRAIVA